MKSIAFLILITAVIIDVFANDWYCLGYVIKPGMRMYQVIEKCGEPVLKEKVGEAYYNSGSTITKTDVCEWVYKYDGLPRILTFHGSKLVKIEIEEIL